MVKAFKLMVVSVLLSVPMIAQAQHIVESRSISCQGRHDGELTFVPAEGRDVADYTYSWRDAGENIIGTEYSLKALGAGVYKLVYTYGGSSTTIQFTLSEPGALLVNPVATSNTNWGATPDACSGSISVNPSGGTAPYSYVIYDETARTTATTSSISNVPSAWYSITVIDSKGCEVSTRVQVEDTQLTETVVGNQVGDTTYTCYKETIGQNVNPSTSDKYPVNVKWDYEDVKTAYYYVMTQAQMNAVPGYDQEKVSVVDSTVNRLGEMVYDTTSLYKVVISNNIDAPIIVLYTTALVSKTEDKPYILTKELSDIKTFESVIDIEGNAYLRMLTQPSSSLSQSELLPGFHICYYWTADGWGARKAWDVVAPPNPVTLNYTKVSNNCYGDLKGQIRVNAQGSWHDVYKTTRFTLRISGPNTNKSASNTLEQSWSGLGAGVYTVTATDIHSCSRSQTIEITQPDYPINILFSTNNQKMSLSNFNQNDCPCVVTGVKDSTFSGGSVSTAIFEAAPGALRYQWSLVTPTAKTPAMIYIDNYQVSYSQSDNGSGTVTSVKINGDTFDNPDLATGQALGNDAIIQAYNSLQAQTSGSSLKGLMPGLYSLRVTDSKGCAVRDTVVITRDSNDKNAEDTSSDCLYNLVTPNGDGFNDVFDLTDISCGFRMKCNIFDINGRKVGTVNKDNENDYSGTYSWDPLNDSFSPATGQTSTYTAFIHLYNDAGTVADYAQSFSVVFYK